MGLRDYLFPKTEIKAQESPAVLSDVFSYYPPIDLVSINRAEAVTVPAVVRCLNLIKGIIGSMELKTYAKATDEELPNLPWVNQLAKAAPNNITISWIVDSLIFYGVAYLKIDEIYQDDNRPARFEYIANNRVTAQLNPQGTYVEYYRIDGEAVPMSGLGSLVTIQSPIEGILYTGARTLRAAVDLEKAASVAASTPQPAGILKNTGADLGEREVSSLLTAWKQARASRSTAYLTSSLDYQPTQFSPKEMAYTDALQYMATQIARLCNIPAYYLSADMNNSMTYSNVQDERRQFVALSLQPYICAIEDRLSMDDITPMTQKISFDIDSGFLRANPLERLNVIEKMLNLNLITIEQARAMEELSPNGNN